MVHDSSHGELFEEFDFFSEEELQEYSEDFDNILLGEEEAAPIFIQAWVQASNKNDDYFKPTLRRELAQQLNCSEQELEREGLDFFQNELPNLKRAIYEANNACQWSSVIDICESLIAFFNIRTYWEELEETLRIALSASKQGQNQLAQARILNYLGHTFRLLGRAQEGIVYGQDSRDLFRKLTDKKGEARALYTLGYLFRSVGNWKDSIRNFENCLNVFKFLGDMEGEADALDGLGQVYTKQGELHQAEIILKEALRIKEELADRFKISITCNNLAKVYLAQNRLEEAEKLFLKSLEIKREIGDRQGQGVSLNELGEINRIVGNFEQAINYYNQSLKLKRQVSASGNSAVSDNHGEGLTLMNIGLLYQAKNELTEALHYWKLAAEKLNDYSPEFEQVSKWLKDLE